MAPEQAALLARYAAVFEPGDPARTGRVAFWDPVGDGPPHLPLGEAGEADLVTARDGEVALRTVPVLRLPVAEALPVLARARRADGADDAHPATAFWGGALAVALHLAARERLLPGVSPGGYDTWRAGPLDPEDVVRLRELADAAPAEALAVPGTEPLALVRAFLDCVADTLPRTAAAEAATGRAAFAAAEPQHVPQLRAWAEEISVGLDSGVRVALRVELEERPEGPPGLLLVPRVHSLADPTLAVDAGELFDSAAHELGPRAQADTVLT
ncbi:ATP-dependent helicase, partial [Streptomyces sp. NPDC057474]